VTTRQAVAKTVVWSGAIALAALVGCRATMVAEAAPAPTRIIRLRYDEWSSKGILSANCHELDSMFVEVQAGGTFKLPRLRH